MADATVYIRVQMPSGAYRYAKPVYNSNRRIKPLYALIDGKPEHHPEGQYCLRYSVDGKRKWERIGNDPSLVLVALQRRNHQLQGLSMGLLSPAAAGMVAGVVAGASGGAGGPGEGGGDDDTDGVIGTGTSAGKVEGGRRKIKDAVTDYLKEIKEQKAHTTWTLRQIVLENHFLRYIATRPTVKRLQDIKKEDLLGFATYLRELGNKPLTVRARVDMVQIFLHRFGLPSLLKGKALPQYTKKVVRAYSEDNLDKMFEAATQDESDLLNFLLCTGARKSEARFACWTDVDLAKKTYTVTEHLDLGYKPKDREEGTIPIPDVLVDVLKARRARFPKTRLIFENREGNPTEDHLLTIKKLALRAGVNCGYCVSKRGKSCATHPVCQQVILHKMRKTFASRLHRNGLPPRTLMRYLRHSDLETTLKYIADEDDDQTRDIVNMAFAARASSPSA